MISYDDVVSGGGPENKFGISAGRCPECGGRGWYDHGRRHEPGQTRCRTCRGSGKVSPEKLVDKDPGQEPLVVPDNVIEQAHGAADNAWTDAEPWRGPRAFAGVIAAWAREQGRAEGAAEERARIREAIKARATEREAEMLEADRKASYKDSPDWAGIRDEKAAMSDELQSLLDDEPALTVLDRDGSDTREGER